VVNELAEGTIESSIRDLIDALEKKDVERAQSFFADDAVWHAPEGEFKGRDEIKRYITWMTSTGRVQIHKFEDTGIGILVKGNKAVYEYMWEATMEGASIQEAGVCLYEFRDDKCVYHRSIYDRLSGAQQGATGFIDKRVVNAVVDRLESGLR
jgi:ketosteroid isomerase-like protein